MESSTKISFTTPPLKEVQRLFSEEVTTFHIGLKYKNYLLMCNMLHPGRCEFNYDQKYTPLIKYMSPYATAGEPFEFLILGRYSYLLKGFYKGYFQEITMGQGTCDVTPYVPPDLRLHHINPKKLLCDISAIADSDPSPIAFQLFTGYAQISPL